ncbi:hypothetical protein HN747_04140 [archaeon]|jgi:ribosomal protein L19E|nr:hypothetical protein [archaeon]
MNLANKKVLAAKALKVGKGRLYFTAAHLPEIKEAITRQDIIDLHKAGAIQIKEVSGRKKIVKRKHRRGVGKVKKKVNTRKREYVIMTRKLRTYVKHMLKTGGVDIETYRTTRKQIRARKFRSKRHMKELLS